MATMETGREFRFECARCSACCRHDPGFVFLSEEDLGSLLAHAGMGRDAFIEAHCRWVDRGDGEVLSLREKPGYDCEFWDGGCTVYEARPLQCRTYPFWPSLIATPGAWEAEALSCPGIGRGPARTQGEAEALAATRSESRLVRR